MQESARDQERGANQILHAMHLFAKLISNPHLKGDFEVFRQIGEIHTELFNYLTAYLEKQNLELVTKVLRSGQNA